METIDIVDPRTTMVKERARGYAIKPKGFPTIRFFPAVQAGENPGPVSSSGPMETIDIVDPRTLQGSSSPQAR